MRRRSLLALAPLALAGCSQPTAPEEGTPQGTPTASSTPTASPTPRSASLSVTEFSVPSVVQIGREFSLSVTVENAGDRAGPFESGVSGKYGTGDWTTTSAEFGFEVPGGESVTEEVRMPTEAYKRPVSFRLDATETVARTTFVGRELAYGESHRLPNGVVLTVEDVGFTDVYTYEAEDGTRSEDPPEGEQWAVTLVSAENTADGTATAPRMSDVILHQGDNEFRGEFFGGENLDGYAGGELGPGESDAGEIPADIPAALTLADLRVDYNRDHPEGEVDLTWSSTPEG